MKVHKFTAAEQRILAGAAEERYERLKGARFYRNADFFLYLCTVVLLALGIHTFFVEPIRVDGDSMVPTLENTEHMFVEKVGYWFSEPKRGEIVICFYPGYTESCVKRVIGLPGETVEVTDGMVRINGSIIDESEYWTNGIEFDTSQVSVGEHEVFVMGDNRNYSKDSRNPSVGCIPYTKIVGRVRAVIWPVSSWRKTPAATY